MKRKNHPKNFKTKVALAVIKSQKIINEMASEFGVHASQENRWKKEAIDALSEVFASKKDQTFKGMELDRDELYQQIGKLQVEVDWF